MGVSVLIWKIRRRLALWNRRCNVRRRETILAVFDRTETPRTATRVKDVFYTTLTDLKTIVKNNGNDHAQTMGFFSNNFLNFFLLFRPRRRKQVKTPKQIFLFFYINRLSA